MKISIIGSGNVASHLAKVLDENGHKILEVYSRNITNAKHLCKNLYHATATNSKDFSQSLADIFIVSLPDDVLQNQITEFTFPENKILTHTSGSVSIEIFNNFNNTQVGVFYPLQTFSKNVKIDFKSVPIIIEACDEETEKILEKLAFSICENVAFYDSNDRKILHLAAVFASNFSNAMYAIAKQIVEKNDLSFEVLKPLIKTSTEKIMSIEPKLAQTGPAIRNDQKTINEHLRLLKNEPDWIDIYQKITKEIQKKGKL